MPSRFLKKQRSRPRRVIIAALLLATTLAAWLSPASAADMRLYAAAGVKAPLEQIARDFEAATGHRVVLLFDTAGAAEQRFIADPAATFLVTTEARLRAAEKD
ncbi:MAG TPA: substrate-binding domain-containing protein, partial [Noviherbaspirillum sp.]